MGLFTQERPSELTVALNSEAHLFYSTDLGYALYNKEVPQGAVLRIGDKIPVACLFEVRWLLLNNEKLGYLFNSQFQVTNKGGYLMTYLNKGVGKATSVEVLVKTDTLVIYSFPNTGALAISPHIGQDIETILLEQ
jgi:hypothetical protein